MATDQVGSSTQHFFTHLISYESVRKGIVLEDFPTELRLDREGHVDWIEAIEWSNNSIRLPDYYEPTDQFAKLALQTTKINSPVFHLDEDGNEYRLIDLPVDGRNLNAGFAHLIRNRFANQFIQEISAGRAATCFESHVNYIIGSSEELTPVQRDLIISLCRIVRRRPIPALYITHMILSNLNNPQAVRAVLSANIWNKRRALERSKSSAQEIYSSFLADQCHTAGRVSILLAGFSKPQFSMATNLAGILSEVGTTLEVLLPDRLLSDHIGIEDAVQMLESNSISTRLVDADAAVACNPALILVSAKLISWSASGKGHVLVNKMSRDFIKRMRIRSKERGSESTSTPTVVTAGLYKFWPADFRQFFRKKFYALNEKRALERSAIVRGDSINAIATDIGLLHMAELEKGAAFAEIRANFLDDFDLFIKSGSVGSETIEKDRVADFVLSSFYDLEPPSNDIRRSEFNNTIRVLFPESTKNEMMQKQSQFERQTTAETVKLNLEPLRNSFRSISSPSKAERLDRRSYLSAVREVCTGYRQATIVGSPSDDYNTSLAHAWENLFGSFVYSEIEGNNDTELDIEKVLEDAERKLVLRIGEGSNLRLI